MRFFVCSFLVFLFFPAKILFLFVCMSMLSCFCYLVCFLSLMVFVLTRNSPNKDLVAQSQFICDAPSLHQYFFYNRQFFSCCPLSPNGVQALSQFMLTPSNYYVVTFCLRCILKSAFSLSDLRTQKWLHKMKVEEKLGLLLNGLIHRNNSTHCLDC